MRYLLILLFLLCGRFQVVAQTCCSGGVPLSNNLGLPNEGKGALSLGLNYDYNNLNTLNAGKDKLDDSSRQRITNSVLMNVGYSFSDRLAVEGLFTWVNQTRTIEQFGNTNFTETSGIGDGVVLLKYAIPDVLGQATVLNFGVGTKIPLGRSDFLTEQGIQLTADLQPGSGAWDGLVWTAISKGLSFRPSATLSGSLTYRATGVNSSYLNNTATYQFGDEAQAVFGYTDQFFLFNTIFNPGIVLKYRRAFEDRIDDQEIPNTGGEWLFLRPELATQIAPDMVISTRLELPIYSYVDGTQLTPTTRITLGISYQVRPKKEISIIN